MTSEAEAHETLERAIEAFLEATGRSGLLTDWVVVTHKLTPNDDGSNDYDTGYVGAQHQPYYRTLGLLDLARTQVMKNIADDSEEED